MTLILTSSYNTWIESRLNIIREKYIRGDLERDEYLLKMQIILAIT